MKITYFESVLKEGFGVFPKIVYSENLTPEIRDFLIFIYSNQGESLSLNNLCEIFKISKPTIVKRIRFLIDNNYIVKVKNKSGNCYYLNLNKSEIKIPIQEKETTTIFELQQLPLATVKETPSNIIEHWNKKRNVIKAKKITVELQKNISKLKKFYNEDKILSCFDNYDAVLGDSGCFFKYKWRLEVFLIKGYKHFIDISKEDCINNFKSSLYKNKFATTDEYKNNDDFNEIKNIFGD